jgi:hypothetical protein
MKHEGLEPGATVIPLAGLVSTTAMIAGAVVAAFVAWNRDWPWHYVLFAGSLGAAISRVVAHVGGKVLFPSDTKEHVLVVKAGKAALPRTLGAAFAGATIGSVFSGLLFAYFLGGASLVVGELAVIVIMPLLVGLLWGLLSALV